MSEPATERSGFARRLAGRLWSAYCAGISVAALASFAARGALWTLNGYDALAHVLLLPAPVGLVLAVRRRRRVLAAGLVVATLQLLVYWLPWLGPSPTSPAVATGATLSVVTWNLGTGTCDPREVAFELRRLAPDVVLLQEARADQARVLFDELADLYPVQRHFDDFRFSKALLSRIEPESVTFVRPEGTKNHLEVVLPVGDRSVRVSSMHTNKAFALRGRAWWGTPAMMAHIADAASRPTNLVVGDFNLTERNAVYRDIRDTGLVDSWRELHAGPGFTFPTFLRYHALPLPPLVRIDFVWHTPDLRCLSIERTAPARSDHCGLHARFAVGE